MEVIVHRISTILETFTSVHLQQLGSLKFHLDSPHIFVLTLSGFYGNSLQSTFLKLESFHSSIKPMVWVYILPKFYLLFLEDSMSINYLPGKLLGLLCSF